MMKETDTIMTTIVASEDGTNTFEIRKQIKKVKGKTAVVIELYPTLLFKNVNQMDLSTMHLLNHMEELGWNDVRIVNLFSKVFHSKPLASQLEFDLDNVAYFEDILEDMLPEDFDVVIAWGSTLNGHAEAKEMKKEFLLILANKNLDDRVMQICVETLSTNEKLCPHPLYLGLRHAGEKWYLENFPLRKVLSQMQSKQNQKGKAKGGQEQKTETSERTKAAQESQVPNHTAASEQKEEQESTKEAGKKADERGGKSRQNQNTGTNRRKKGEEK